MPYNKRDFRITWRWDMGLAGHAGIYIDAGWVGEFYCRHCGGRDGVFVKVGPMAPQRKHSEALELVKDFVHDPDCALVHAADRAVQR